MHNAVPNLECKLERAFEFCAAAERSTQGVVWYRLIWQSLQQLVPQQCHGLLNLPEDGLVAGSMRLQHLQRVDQRCVE